MARPSPLALIRGVCGAALLLGLAAPAAAEDALLLARDRASPERLEEAVAHPVYNAVLERYLARKPAEVILAHAGGAEGSAWADAIRGWLVALGIPGPRIRMDPGVAEAGRMRIRVEGRG